MGTFFIQGDANLQLQPDAYASKKTTEFDCIGCIHSAVRKILKKFGITR